MTDLEHVDLDLLAGLTAELDPLMYGILASDDVKQAGDFVDDVTRHCMKSPYLEHLSSASSIYCIWMDIDDILDGWPVEYGPDSKVLALREFKRAAQEWLDMPRTQAGLQDYLRGVHWRQRGASPGDHDDLRQP
ncbi:hypothetical protein Aple_090280 [Acrocarpospora pleiomorpha]|uniref:Uncharacterized protein n=1 Tax=Acrocarpospora pleiomorpha TaxID=90975 RepID=A0A5M3Y1S1_9ACTN|nr:hypothetical protein [Acrocarpospora pleiomorpha]GES26129.1 hypothetical protein Aple_090280 [Acrocarpospora pleiomorpha]